MIRASIFAGIDQTLENGFREIIFTKKESGLLRNFQSDYLATGQRTRTVQSSAVKQGMKLTLHFRLVRMEDEGFKLQQSGKIFNGEIYKPTTTIPIFIKMNKVSGEIRTPNIIQRNNIEFLVQVSTTEFLKMAHFF